jgi:hypothetical protein
MSEASSQPNTQLRILSGHDYVLTAKPARYCVPIVTIIKVPVRHQFNIRHMQQAGLFCKHDNSMNKPIMA